jgi:paraquat-inducible protein A
MIRLGWREITVLVLSLISLACLVLGVTKPVMKLTRLYFWTDTHSISSVIQALYYTNEIFLAVVIFTFSILFPSLKILLIVLIAASRVTQGARRSVWFRRLEHLGKWSMLDVLVLALLVFYAKSTQFADATALPGIYYFTASVVLTMFAYALLDTAEEDTPAPPASAV